MSNQQNILSELDHEQNGYLSENISFWNDGIGLKFVPRLSHSREGDTLRGCSSSLRRLCSYIVFDVVIVSAQ